MEIRNELKLLQLQDKATDITMATEKRIYTPNTIENLIAYWDEVYNLNLELLKEKENYKAMVIDLKKQLTRSEARNIK